MFKFGKSDKKKCSEHFKKRPSRTKGKSKLIKIKYPHVYHGMKLYKWKTNFQSLQNSSKICLFGLDTSKAKYEQQKFEYIKKIRNARKKIINTVRKIHNKAWLHKQRQNKMKNKYASYLRSRHRYRKRRRWGFNPFERSRNVKRKNGLGNTK